MASRTAAGVGPSSGGGGGGVDRPSVGDAADEGECGENGGKEPSSESIDALCASAGGGSCSGDGAEERWGGDGAWCGVRRQYVSHGPAMSVYPSTLLSAADVSTICDLPMPVTVMGASASICCCRCCSVRPGWSCTLVCFKYSCDMTSASRLLERSRRRKRHRHAGTGQQRACACAASSAGIIITCTPRSSRGSRPGALCFQSMATAVATFRPLASSACGAWSWSGQRAASGAGLAPGLAGSPARAAALQARSCAAQRLRPSARLRFGAPMRVDSCCRCRRLRASSADSTPSPWIGPSCLRWALGSSAVSVLSSSARQFFCRARDTRVAACATTPQAVHTRLLSPFSLSIAGSSHSHPAQRARPGASWSSASARQRSKAPHAASASASAEAEAEPARGAAGDPRGPGRARAWAAAAAAAAAGAAAGAEAGRQAAAPQPAPAPSPSSGPHACGPRARISLSAAV